jgi:hypothetical protein
VNGNSICAVFALVCFAIPAFSSPCFAASIAIDPKSKVPSVVSPENHQHCDNETTDADDDTNDGGAQATKKAKEDADSSDDQSDAADQNDSDHGRADATTHQGKDDNGCSNDANVADDDSDDADKVDTDDRPTLESHFDYYTDSSHYVNITTTSLATAPYQGFMVLLRRDWLQARDSNGPQAVEITTLGFNRELTELWGIGGGFGTARGLQHSDLVGSLQSHFNYKGLSVTASIAREMLLESAQAVKANIRQTDFGLSLSDELSEHVTADAEVHHHIYSDGNSSNQIEFSPDYTFAMPLGKLALGYRFSYMTFAKNPESGYWAPQKALSDGLSAAWSFDRTVYYARTELGLDYDSVREIGKLSDGPSSGPGASAAVAFGIRLMKGTELETYWTGNGSPGWNSMNVGISLKYLF